MFRRPANRGIPPVRDGAQVEIGPMRRRHVRQISAIEERVYTRPWSAALYLSELTQPSTRRYFVATVDGDVVGYIGCMLIAGDGHITTVAVAPEWHRHGIGRRLMLHAAEDARANGATALTLEVRVSNTGAQELYRQFGFAPAGIRKNYYSEVNEDAIVMWASDVDTPEYAERLADIAGKLVTPTVKGRNDE